MAATGDSFSVSERNLQRWRMIKIVSLLPLLLSVVLMFFFKGSMLGMVLFFLILIVGVVLPQVCENQVRSHLLLQAQLEALEKKMGSPAS